MKSKKKLTMEENAIGVKAIVDAINNLNKRLEVLERQHEREAAHAMSLGHRLSGDTTH